MTARTWTRWLTTRDGTSPGDALRTMATRHGKWSTWLVPAIYAGCLTAFFADLRSADTLAFGVFYVPLVATAVFHRDKRAVWVLTGIACTMVIVGSFFPDIAADVRGLIWNRVLSVCAVLATAMFVRHARSIQDQLAEQTGRAEAAERIKTEVLTNLSQEIRAPLYSMIGVLELAAADSRPDQKAALGMVRNAGRRLMTTMDNLVDLTQFEERPMPVESMDLGALLRQVADARRPDALARQINLRIDIPSMPSTIVCANLWAVRRILENTIGDAITHTPPGGGIDIRIVNERDQCSAVVAATGTWPPAALQTAAGPAAASLVPSDMGLALSQRLARAIGARLLFSNRPDEGMTVRLSLPTAARPKPGHG